MLELGQIIRSFISLLIFHFMAPSVLAKCQLKCYLNTHCHKLWFTHSLMCNVAFFNTPLRDKSTCSLCTTASHCESGIWGRLGDWRIAENSCKCISLNQLRYHLLLVVLWCPIKVRVFHQMSAAFLAPILPWDMKGGESKKRQLSFWWQTLILIGHYGRKHPCRISNVANEC